MFPSKNKKIIEISQDDHYCLHLHYAEKTKHGVVKIPRYGADKKYDDIRITNLVNDMIKRKNEIKFVMDTFHNKKRYTQIVIDDRIIVLKDPFQLFQRADFSELALTVRSRKRQLRLQQAKLKRTAIRGIAIGLTTSVLAGGVISAIATLKVDASANQEISAVESDESREAITPIEQEISSVTSEDEKLGDESPLQEEVLPEPVIIPDEINLNESDYDIPSEDNASNSVDDSNTYTVLSNDSYQNDNLEFLGSAYGISESEIEQICNIYNLDAMTSSFSSVQEVISDAYWQSPQMYAPAEISADQNDVEKEICKAATAYGFTSDEEMATLIAISRLETGYYTSEKFRNLNNLAGVRDGSGNFIHYNNISQGAIGLVKSVSKIKGRMLQNGTYNENQTLACNIGPIFCPANESEAPWGQTVDGLKEKILTSGELQNIRQSVNYSNEQNQGVTR